MIYHIVENFDGGKTLTDAVNVERFAGLNFYGFHPMKFFIRKLSQCLTFKYFNNAMI